MTAARDSLVVAMRSQRAPGQPALPLAWRAALDDDAGHGPLPLPYSRTEGPAQPYLRPHRDSHSQSHPHSQGSSRTVLLVAAVSALLLLSGCYREQRPVKAPPAASSTPAQSQSTAAQAGIPVANRYEENAYAVSQGKSLYKAYNCNGCHASGGGNMGPPLMDDKWRYGADPANIFQTISNGRPNGMPAFGKHVPEDQIWMLVAYVRSMSGQLREDVAPTRSDSLQAAKPESRRKREQPTHEAAPDEER